jgi:hypothetical protein
LMIQGSQPAPALLVFRRISSTVDSDEGRHHQECGRSRDSVYLLSAAEPVPGSDQPGRNADWMIGGDLRRASGREDHRKVPLACSPVHAPPFCRRCPLANR